MMRHRLAIYFILILGIFFVACFSGNAQTSSNYSQYYLNRQAFNPGAVGFEEYLTASLLLRDQWLTIEGEPVLQNLNISSPVKIARGGVGLQLQNEYSGAYKTTALSFSYAYKKGLSWGSISLGFSAGVVQKVIEGAKLRAPEGIYESGINHNDPNIPIGSERALIPDFGVGLFVQKEDLQIGLSLKNALQSKVSLNTVEINTKPEIYGEIRYIYQVASEVAIYPGILVKTDGIKSQYDVNAIAEVQKNFYGGLSIRGVLGNKRDAVAVITGVKLNNKLYIGYAYDIGISKLRSYNGGSHELVISYRMDFDGISSPSPRFL